MKKSVIAAICLGLVLLGACSSGKTPPLTPMPEEKPLYGFTKDGVFFVHDSLVKNAGGSIANLASQATEWKHRPMSRAGDYHIYDCNDRNHDKALFVFYDNFKIQYSFYVDKYVSIPAVFEKNKDVQLHIGAEDIVNNLKYGLVFFTHALEDDPKLW